MSVILEHVSKAYGRQKALDDIGFRLEEGFSQLSIFTKAPVKDPFTT